MDRNHDLRSITANVGKSLSARRAWIEIQGGDWVAVRVEVALRKESVDRNGLIWQRHGRFQPVALRKESVDRNDQQITQFLQVVGRSPQGERG